MTNPSTNDFAVVTGASSGIGYELAVQFAEHGYDLLITAEDEGIEQAGQNLRRDGQNQVTVFRADLATAEGVAALFTAIQGTETVRRRRTVGPTACDRAAADCERRP